MGASTLKCTMISEPSASISDTVDVIRCDSGTSGANAGVLVVLRTDPDDHPSTVVVAQTRGASTRHSGGSADHVASRA